MNIKGTGGPVLGSRKHYGLGGMFSTGLPDAIQKANRGRCMNPKSLEGENPHKRAKQLADLVWEQPASHRKLGNHAALGLGLSANRPQLLGLGSIPLVNGEPLVGRKRSKTHMITIITKFTMKGKRRVGFSALFLRELILFSVSPHPALVNLVSAVKCSHSRLKSLVNAHHLDSGW